MKLENVLFKNRIFSTAKSRGFTLIELLIAIALGLLIIASVMSAVTSSVQSSKETTDRVKTMQELDSIIDLMSSEIRRTGYSLASNSTTFLSTSSNVFGISVPTAAKDCVLFQYERNNATVPGVVDANERMGFRLSGSVIQYGEGVTACDAGSWQSITDVNGVVVSKLIFTLTEACSNVSNIPITKNCTTPAPITGQLLVTTRDILIELEGRSATVPTSTTRILTSSIRIENDSWRLVP